MAHGPTEPLTTADLERIFGLPPEDFRPQVCADPQRFLDSAMGLGPDALGRIITASAPNFHWYHGTFVRLMAPVLVNVAGSFVPTRNEDAGNWTAALERQSLVERPTQHRLARYLARAGRVLGPPAATPERWQPLQTQGGLGRQALPVHWGPVFAQIDAMRDRDAGSDFTDQAWLLQYGRRGALLALYGTLTEGWLYTDAPNRIPGPAVRVGGRAHADFWDISHGPNETLIVEGLGETKSSIHGYANGGRKQIRRFLKAMTEANADIQLYGHRIDPARLRFRLADGRLVGAAEVREALQLDVWTNGTIAPDHAAPQDASDGHWDAHFVPRFHALFAASFYQVVLPSDEARLVEAHRKYLGSTVGTVTAGPLDMLQLRRRFTNFVVNAFRDRFITTASVNQLVFANEDDERRVLLHLDVGQPKPTRARAVPTVGVREAQTPVELDPRFRARDYDAVLEAALASRSELQGLKDPGNFRALAVLRLLLPRLGFRLLFRPDGTLRPITLTGTSLVIGAAGRARAFTVRWSASTPTPELTVTKTGAILLLPLTEDGGAAALAQQHDPFWDAGLVGHDLQRFTPGAWLRREREALGEPSIILKPGQRVELGAFTAEAAELAADSPPMRRFILAPPAYGKTIILATSAAALVHMKRAHPKRGLTIAVTGQEPVIDQIAQELADQLPRDGKTRFVGRGDAAVRKNAKALMHPIAEGDVVVPMTWSELNALLRKATVDELKELKESVRAVLIDEPQELEDHAEYLAALTTLTEGQTGIIVAGYSASALREAIVSADGPFGGRVFPIYPELAQAGLEHAMLAGQTRAMREGMITPFRANADGHVITHFTPTDVVATLPESELIETYTRIRGVPPSADEIARVRDEAAQALIGSRKYRTLSVEGRTVGWLATVRMMHGEGLLTRERGFLRFTLRLQAEDFFKVADAYAKAHALPQRFAQYFHDSPDRRAVLEGIRSEDPATRIDWVVTCHLMDVGVDATPLTTAVVFAQEIDPELFAQVGGRPTRLHDGKTHAHLWLVSREVMTEQGLLDALGRKADALEKVAIGASSGNVAVSLAPAVSDVDEPQTPLPAVVPLTASLLPIPNEAMSETERDRYRLLAALHQKVIFAKASTPEGNLANIVDCARFAVVARLLLENVDNIPADIAKFIRTELDQIRRGRSRRYSSGTLTRFDNVVKGIHAWTDNPKPDKAALIRDNVLQVLLLDAELFADLLSRSPEEGAWPTRLESRATEVVSAMENTLQIRLAKADLQPPAEAIPAMVTNFESLNLPLTFPTDASPLDRFRGYLEFRRGLVEKLLNDAKPVDAPDRETVYGWMLAMDRVVRVDASLWNGIDRWTTALRTEARTKFRIRLLFALSRLPGARAANLMLYPDSFESMVYAREQGTGGNFPYPAFERAFQALPNNATTGAPPNYEQMAERWRIFLNLVSSNGGSYLKTFLDFQHGYSNADQLVPSWLFGYEPIKKLQGTPFDRKKRPVVAAAHGMPIEAYYDPQQDHAFVQLPLEELLSPEERADGFDALPAFHQAVAEWTMMGEDLIAAQEAHEQQKRYTGPGEARFNAVAKAHHRMQRVVALFDRLTDTQRVATTADFRETMKVANATVSVSVMALGHPMSGYDAETRFALKTDFLQDEAARALRQPVAADSATLLAAISPQALHALTVVVESEAAALAKIDSHPVPHMRALGREHFFRYSVATPYLEKLVANPPARTASSLDFFKPLRQVVAKEERRRTGTPEPVDTDTAAKPWTRPATLARKLPPTEERWWVQIESFVNRSLDPKLTVHERRHAIDAATALMVFEYDEQRRNLEGSVGRMRKQLETAQFALRNALKALPANGSPFTQLLMTSVEMTGRSNDRLDSLSSTMEMGIRLTEGPLYFWALAARRAIVANQPIPTPIPDAPELDLDAQFATKLPADGKARVVEAMQREGMLLAGETRASVLDRAARTCRDISVEVRQLLQRARVAKTTVPDATLSPLLLRMADAFHILAVGNERSTALAPIVAGLRGAVPSRDAFQAAEAFNYEFDRFIRDGLNTIGSMERMLEATPFAYSALGVEPVRGLEQKLQLHLTRLLRETSPSHIQTYNLPDSDSLTLGVNTAVAYTGAFGVSHKRAAAAARARAIAESILAGKLLDTPIPPPLTDGKILAEDEEPPPETTLSEVPAKGTLWKPTLTVDPDDDAAASQWLGLLGRWQFDPAYLALLDNNIRRSEKEPLWSVQHEENSRYYESEVAKAKSLLEQFPVGLALYPSESDCRAVEGAIVDYLTALKVWVANPNQKAIPTRPAILRKNIQLEAEKGLRVLTNEQLDVIKVAVERFETEMEAISTRWNFRLHEDRHARFRKAVFDGSAVGFYLAALQEFLPDAKSIRTPSDLRELVEKTRARPISSTTAAALGRPPVTPGTLFPTRIFLYSAISPITSQKQAALTEAILTYRDPAAQREAQIQRAALLLMQLGRTLSTDTEPFGAAESAVYRDVLTQSIAFLPADHPWRDAFIAYIGVLAQTAPGPEGRALLLAEMLKICAQDVMAYRWAGKVIKLSASDAWPKLDSFPMPVRNVRPFFIDREAAERALTRLETNGFWTAPADVAGDPQTAYMLALEDAHAELSAFRATGLLKVTGEAADAQVALADRLLKLWTILLPDDGNLEGYNRWLRTSDGDDPEEKRRRLVQGAGGLCTYIEALYPALAPHPYRGGIAPKRSLYLQMGSDAQRVIMLQGPTLEQTLVPLLEDLITKGATDGLAKKLGQFEESLGLAPPYYPAGLLGSLYEEYARVTKVMTYVAHIFADHGIKEDFRADAVLRAPLDAKAIVGKQVNLPGHYYLNLYEDEKALMARERQLPAKASLSVPDFERRYRQWQSRSLAFDLLYASRFLEEKTYVESRLYFATAATTDAGLLLSALRAAPEHSALYAGKSRSEFVEAHEALIAAAEKLDPKCDAVQWRKDTMAVVDLKRRINEQFYRATPTQILEHLPEQQLELWRRVLTLTRKDALKGLERARRNQAPEETPLPWPMQPEHAESLYRHSKLVEIFLAGEVSNDPDAPCPRAAAYAHEVFQRTPMPATLEDAMLEDIDAEQARRARAN